MFQFRAFFLAVRFCEGALCLFFLESTLVFAVNLLLKLILILGKEACYECCCLQKGVWGKKLASPMASTGTQLAASISSSSSSSSPHRRKYDLFLSFRGADTRYEFADTLFTSLKRWGIVVFRDDEGLQRGEEINPALEDAIKKSHYAVFIVSPNYTKSKACMMELTVILECKRKGRLDVFPVFYHIDPSNVGKLTTDFEGYLDTQKNYAEDPKENSEYWKSLLDKLFDGHVDLEEMSGSALKKLSNISAWVVRENSYINPIIEEICKAIWDRTKNDSPSDSETLVGMESREGNVMGLL